MTDPSSVELTLGFINRYRQVVGQPPVAAVGDLREALGDQVKVYRYREPGRQFAITKSTAIRDALVIAGAVGVIPFRYSPDSPVEFYDINLPAFLWSFI